MNSQPAPGSRCHRPGVRVLLMPARCDCGYRWTFEFDSEVGSAWTGLGCPLCGAGLEIRAYGRPVLTFAEENRP